MCISTARTCLPAPALLCAALRVKDREGSEARPGQGHDGSVCVTLLPSSAFQTFTVSLVRLWHVPRGLELVYRRSVRWYPVPAYQVPPTLHLCMLSHVRVRQKHCASRCQCTRQSGSSRQGAPQSPPSRISMPSLRCFSGTGV